MKAILILNDGTAFEGVSVGALGTAVGEIVFNTAMCGYQEILTDPAVYGSIVTFTFPLALGYGINVEDSESDGIKARGVVLKEACAAPSNFRCSCTLGQYLAQQNVVGIEGVDTRALTQHIRDFGSMKAVISTQEGFTAQDAKKAIADDKPCDPIAAVTVKNAVCYNECGSLRIAALDLGITNSLIGGLTSKDCSVTVFPIGTDFGTIAASSPDGILLSDGPAGPEQCKPYFPLIKKLYESKLPLLAVGSGHIALAAALGLKTDKLKFGHRGSNHPVKDIAADIVFATNQNHGYIIDTKSVDGKLAKITHINMHDGTVEGLSYQSPLAVSVQFQPDSTPGSQPCSDMLSEFVALVCKNKTK